MPDCVILRVIPPGRNSKAVGLETAAFCLNPFHFTKTLFPHSR